MDFIEKIISFYIILHLAVVVEKKLNNLQQSAEQRNNCWEKFVCDLILNVNATIQKVRGNVLEDILELDIEHESCILWDDRW